MDSNKDSNKDSNLTPELGIDTALNELERDLFACLSGELSREDFIAAFLRATVFIMVDGEPVGNTLGDKKPLVIADGPDEPRLMAVFSDPSRAEKIIEMFGAYTFPIMVDAVWVLGCLGPHMGIAFNPGCHFGFEIAPEGAQELKHAVEQAIGQSQPASQSQS